MQKCDRAMQKYDMVEFEGQILMVDKVTRSGDNLFLVDAQGDLVAIAGADEVYVLDKEDKMRVRLVVVKAWKYEDE